MPDYNPDRDGWRDHRFIVQPSSKRPNLDSVKTASGRKLDFNHEKRFTTRDVGLARELQKEYGQEIVVTRTTHPHVADRGHTYFFAMQGVPYAQYDELGRRIKE